MEAIIFFGMGGGRGPEYTEECYKFLERKIGDHKYFDDQNEGQYDHRLSFYFVQTDKFQ